ncbi:hypothetical protein ERW52_18505, partial [Aliivibrio finisterrensis]
SYGFLQTPPLASDALAIRIVFPLVGVTLLSCKQTGLPALLGKQKTQNDYSLWVLFCLLLTNYLDIIPFWISSCSDNCAGKID